MMDLSDGERISMIHSAVLIQYTRVTHRQTYGIGVAYTALSIASRGKKPTCWQLARAGPGRFLGKTDLFPVFDSVDVCESKMSSKSGKKLTKQEELLLQDFSRNVSTKSSALFYGNAVIVSIIPICESHLFTVLLPRRPV